MNNMNEYGRRPGDNAVDPLIVIPPPRHPYRPPYTTGPCVGPCIDRPWVPIGRPCYGPGCRRRRDYYDRDWDWDRGRGRGYGRGPWR